MISIILGIVSNLILTIIQKTGYLGVFLLMALESANIPIPSEVIMPFSGFLAAQGILNFWLVAIVGAFGNLGGSLFSYWLGFLIRRGAFKWDNHKFSAEIQRAQKWTERFGDWAILLSRVLPIVRTFISLPLGILKVKSLWRFSVLTFSGALIWSIFLTWLGFILGKNWGILRVYFHKFDYLILGLILLAIGWWIWRHFKKSSQHLTKS